MLLRLKELGLEMKVQEPFTWTSPSLDVSVKFWADEAAEVKGYRIDTLLVSCPCAR